VGYNRYVAWVYRWKIHDKLSRFQVRLFGDRSSLCCMVLQLRSSWQAVKISSAPVWWPIIPMSHGFTVEEFTTSCQDFKFGCLVAYHPYLAWFYSKGICDKQSRFQMWLFFGLSFLSCMVLLLRNSRQAVKISSVVVWWPVFPMSHGITIEEFVTSCQDLKCGCLVAYHTYVEWFYSWGIHDKLSRFQVCLFGGLSSLYCMV